MLTELMLAGIGKTIYDVNKSLKMDAEATAKYSKAFTREYEAQRKAELKREYADKRLENVAKKKKAVINVSLPVFADVYRQIQNINITSKDRKFELLNITNKERISILQHAEIISQKQFTNKELMLGTVLKGISGMIIEDSKRNLSAARSQMRASGIVCEQARSLEALYDAIAQRADRIAALLVSTNAMFLGIISETEKIIAKNGKNISAYSEYEKSIITTCVNLAVAMTKFVDIPVLEENGEIAESAVEMIQTGEKYISELNSIIREV